MGLFGMEREIEHTSKRLDPSQDSSDKRPGKFLDLSEFMAIDGFHPNYVPGTQAPVDSGDIIYIKDKSTEGSRINGRVMLILFHNRPFTYTCLSFCCHPDFSSETLHNSYALVCTDPDQQPAQLLELVQQSSASLLRLKVRLGHNNTPLSVKPDIYLNLRENWTVEQEVQLVSLGRVERNSYKLLVPTIEKLYSQSLTSANILRDCENPPASDSQESAGPARKGSNHKDKGYANKNKGKKKSS